MTIDEVVQPQTQDRRREWLISAIAAAIGALVPVVWGVLAFVSFEAHESLATKIFWDAVYVTCPPWLLDTTQYSMLLTPVLNAAIYFVVAFAFLRIQKLRRRNPT